MKLYDPSVGAAFGIPESTWQLFTFRVGATLIAQEAGIVPALSTLVPQFDQLVAASTQWNASTFNGLVALAPQIAQFAAVATGQLSALQKVIAGLDQSQPVPAPVAAQIKQAFGAIAARAQQIAAAAAQLQPQLLAFCNANQPVCLAELTFRSQLSGVTPLSGAMPVLLQLDVALAEGISVAAGAWGAISDDLASLAGDTVQVDFPLLASLDIEVAIRGWQTVQSEAAAFAANIPQWVNPCFMNGSWITDSQSAASVFNVTEPILLFAEYLILSAGLPPTYGSPPSYDLSE